MGVGTQLAGILTGTWPLAGVEGTCHAPLPQPLPPPFCKGRRPRPKVDGGGEGDLLGPKCPHMENYNPCNYLKRQWWEK